jgi:hypothetical protein
MLALPPAVLIAIAAVTAAIPTIIFLMTIGAPFFRTWLKEHVKKQELERLHNALRGAATVVSAIAKETAGFTLDDGFGQILDLAANEVGKALLEKYPAEAAAYMGALHADERRPDLKLGTDVRAKDVPAAIKRASKAANSGGSSTAVPT